MDNNNNPNVAHNDDSSSVTTDPIIDITQGVPTAVMDSNRQPLMTPAAQQELVDMLMTVEENDDMPSLYDASFTESDIEDTVVDSNLGAQDMRIPVFQQNNHVLNASSSQSSAFSTSLPPPSPTGNSPPLLQRNSNRRARVDDDDGDGERDLRPPSQRVGASNDQASTSNVPPNPFIGPFFTSFRDAGTALGLGLGAGFFGRTPNSNTPENSNTSNMNSNDSNTNPVPGTTTSSQSQSQGPPQNASATNRRPPVQFVDYEFSIVMDGSRRPQPAQRVQHQAPLNDPNVQGQPGGNAPAGTPAGPTIAGAVGPPPNISFNPPIPLGNLATLLGIPFPLPGFGFPPLPEEKEDPERAKKLVDGLEEVPVGLVRRLERVGTGGGGIGEDESKGGDVGCAVCWDRLLREEVEQERLEEPTESMMVDGEAGETTTKDMGVEPKYPKVVSLPCAHVFHAECLIPWFSQPRHTTCPTCRFNIDPDNLTYVSPRQRRREQRRAANNNNNNDVNQPSEGTPEDPASITPSVAVAMDTGEQPPQLREQQGEGPVADLGGGFAGVLQMLNEQGQPQPAAGAPDNGAVPPGAQPQAQWPQAPGPPPLMMSIPMPVGGAGNFFPVGFAAGQLPMAIPMPFMAVPLQPGNAEGDSFLRSGVLRTTNVPISPPPSWVNYPAFWSAAPMPMPMPMPWRMMADPIHMASGGGNRTNATHTDASGGAPNADDVNATPAATVEPSSSNNSPQVQTPHHPPTIVADVVRISVDMVFDGRSRRPATQGPGNNSTGPQPAGGNTDPQNANQDQEQATDDDGDHDLEDEPLAPMSQEEAEEEERRFTEVLNQMRRNRQNPASNGRNAAPPATGNNSEQPAPQPGLPVYSMEDIHVAGTGRSFGEAFTQALFRLQSRMAQPRQDDQNPQPADATAAAANENLPPPPPPPQQAEAQAQGQHPWQFMAMPFMEFGIPRAPQPEGPKRTWAPPPPPGPTLRQRIERREWEAGLRCHDVSCGLGPSDEDPLGDDINESLRKSQQLSIMSKEGDGEAVGNSVCGHRFHNTCLVSAERVALRGAEAITNEAGGVEVSCPVCRGTGCVTKEQWDEGVLALQ